MGFHDWRISTLWISFSIVLTQQGITRTDELQDYANMAARLFSFVGILLEIEGKLIWSFVTGSAGTRKGGQF